MIHTLRSQLGSSKTFPGGSRTMCAARVLLGGLWKLGGQSEVGVARTVCLDSCALKGVPPMT